MQRFGDGTGSPLRQDALDDDAEVAPVQFEQLEIRQAESHDRDVDQYDNVSLTVSIELGRIEKTVQEVLGLKEGALIETEKLSGMPMEVLVNGELFGRGEVVVVGDSLAIRITELIKTEESKSQDRR
jgi:flagellar motor switch protein FliN/FliY